MTAPLAKPRPPAIPELAVARTLAPLTVEAGCVPAGTRGTVVHVYRGAAAYELEIQSPFHAVVTVDSDYLAPA